MSEKIILDINNRPLSIEIGKIGRQADGSALVRYGETIMFCTATSKKEVKEMRPFLPLIVDYRENTYAAGKIPGGFFKRQGRPSEREILVSRLIDRPIRPLFPEGYFFDTQIIALLLSADLENEPDTLGVIGASAALYFSDIPFTAPLGAVKVGLVDGRLMINPTAGQLEKSPLNMVIVGTDQGIIMIEAEAVEIEEDKVIEAVNLALEPISQIIEAQKALFQKLSIKKRAFTVEPMDRAKVDQIEQRIAADLLQAIQLPEKKASEAESNRILKGLIESIPPEDEAEISAAKEIYHSIEKKLVRDLILNQGKRSDGRGFDEIRPISIEVGLLPRTHGSALFTRGETQCLATVTLGTFEDVQRLDGLGEEAEKRFMLHYNFPPFSVGEVSFLRAAGRREIGHGALAEKSIVPSIPDAEVFPYTIRIVSDILESNGSSSMATVCGGVLALMDAGVPLSMTVAGIAIGLVTEGSRYMLLTDIAGLEDHFGDMDLKVTGTEKGITAIQLDLKIPSISLEIFREGLVKARNARLEVLDKMKQVIPSPRLEISPYAPRILTLFINPEKVSEVIGPAGKIIKKIIASTKAKIDIEEGGKIVIASTDMQAAEKAKEMIREITLEAEVGKVYNGKVVRIEEYGAFLEILPNIIGLLHVSEIAHHHVRSVRDVLKMGQMLEVKVISIDEDNKVRVSRKALEERPASMPDSEGRQERFPRRKPEDRNPRRSRDRSRF
ncbi:MAG: polyribonucleotide nucleotidyltransferase [Candidatus Aminicenantales bacterium]